MHLLRRTGKNHKNLSLLPDSLPRFEAGSREPGGKVLNAAR